MDTSLDRSDAMFRIDENILDSIVGNIVVNQTTVSRYTDEFISQTLKTKV